MLIAKRLRQSFILFSSALLIIGFCACAAKKPRPETGYIFAMDTAVSCTVYGENAHDAIEAAWAEVRRLDALLSKTAPGSEVSAINASGTGGVTVSGETAELIALSLEYAALTCGAFDITVGPVMELWGFGGDSPAVPGRGALSKVLQSVGSEYVEISGNTVTLTRPGMAIDIGGAGKGYAANLAAAAARENGVLSALFYLGGNVITIGGKPDGSPWIVAIQDPSDKAGYIGRLSIRDSSVVTSGGYERYFEAGGKVYHHIIDPKTGCPAENGLISVTVVGKDSAAADILSTALFVMGKERALDLWREAGGFSLVLVTEENEVVVTGDIAADFEFTGGEAGYFLTVLQNP